MRWQLIFLIAYFLSITTLFFHPVDSGDFFHHLNTGRYIFNNLRLPYYDDLTFTAYGQPWVAHEWGSGVIYFVIFRFFGYFGISLLFALLGTTAFLFLFLILKELKIHFYPRLIFTFLAAAIASLRWPTRPEVMATVFLSILIYTLLSKKYFRVLPLFFWLWGIIYGASVFLGILVFVFWITVTKSFSRKVFLILTISFILSMLNGYGFSSLLYIFQISKHASYSEEWQPFLLTINKNFPSLVLFYQYIFITYILFITLYTALVTSILFKKQKVITSNLFIFGLSVCIFAPIYSNRFITLSALMATAALSIAWQNTKPKIKITTLLVAILILLFATCIRFNQFDFGWRLKQWPFQTNVTNFLRLNNINGNIFASQEIGAFLSWYLPNSKVFVDTRDDLYSNTQVFQDLATLTAGKLNILSLIDKYKANIIVGRITSGPIYKPIFYSDEWKIAYITNGYFVAFKKSGFGNVGQDLTAIDTSNVPPAKTGQLETAQTQLSTLIKNDNTVSWTKYSLISIKLALNKPQEAEDILNTIKISKRAEALDRIGMLELSGKVFLAQGKCYEAKKNFIAAKKLNEHRLVFSPKTKLDLFTDKNLVLYHLICR